MEVDNRSDIVQESYVSSDAIVGVANWTVAPPLTVSAINHQGDPARGPSGESCTQDGPG